MDHGDGWIVIQRRMDGSVDFYRNWKDYVEGFGDLEGEFWLGLDKINQLTAIDRELYVVLTDYDQDMKTAIYSQFRIDDGDKEYQLHVSGFQGNPAGDSLSYHNGQKFSTKDRDNDIHFGNNCAVQHTGAWWYKNCLHSNLNGRYLVGTTTTYSEGVIWKTFKGFQYSLKRTEMMIRPKL